MTIQQLISKLNQATNQKWHYEIVDEEVSTFIGGTSTMYSLMIDGDFQYLVERAIIDNITPESFEAKELIDVIINNDQFLIAIKKAIANLKEALEDEN